MINSAVPTPRSETSPELISATDLLQTFLCCSRTERLERFVDTRTAARMTGLSRRTIQWWIETGLVEAIRIGRRYQIDRSSLVAHLALSSEP